MASETKRRCGYRKVSGLYLVSSPGNCFPCDRLPHLLDICPTCNHGIHQARGWTWIDVNGLFSGPHHPCEDVTFSHGMSTVFTCPLCGRPDLMGRAGLIWIGEKFYPTPQDFLAESETLGISRRIAAVPRGFEVGKTWVLLAHPKTILLWRDIDGSVVTAKEMLAKKRELGYDATFEQVWRPAIFRVWRPERIEKIITESQSKDPELMKELATKNITPVVVPDSDKDHQGSVYDDEGQSELFEEAVS